MTYIEPISSIAFAKALRTAAEGLDADSPDGDGYRPEDVRRIMTRMAERLIEQATRKTPEELQVVARKLFTEGDEESSSDYYREYLISAAGRVRELTKCTLAEARDAVKGTLLNILTEEARDAVATLNEAIGRHRLFGDLGIRYELIRLPEEGRSKR